MDIIQLMDACCCCCCSVYFEMNCPFCSTHLMNNLLKNNILHLVCSQKQSSNRSDRVILAGVSGSGGDAYSTCSVQRVYITLASRCWGVCFINLFIKEECYWCSQLGRGWTLAPCIDMQVCVWDSKGLQCRRKSMGAVHLILKGVGPRTSYIRLTGPPGPHKADISTCHVQLQS